MIKLLYLCLILTLSLQKLGATNMTKVNAHQFSFTDLDNNIINLADYHGKVVLIVNTASKCGFTPQYKSLENLYLEYKDKGLIILAVPSDDFAKQEFSENQKIKEFTEENFNISFPISCMEKIKGNNAHPFYLWARTKAGFIGSPKWNFHKYLIDKNGELAAWFSSSTKPESKKIIKKIDELLI